ncbi:MAG: hypothetical protein K0Q55_2066 [Verrucomicrobia bacterium]|nr:hypothetical protein [Verrucomicrobiota bacterium]
MSKSNETIRPLQMYLILPPHYREAELQPLSKARPVPQWLPEIPRLVI